MTRKNVIIFSVSTVVIFAVIYLLGAFYYTSFNIQNWDETGRLASIAIYTTLILPLLGLCFSYNDV